MSPADIFWGATIVVIFVGFIALSADAIAGLDGKTRPRRWE